MKTKGLLAIYWSAAGLLSGLVFLFGVAAPWLISSGDTTLVLAGGASIVLGLPILGAIAFDLYLKLKKVFA